MICIYKPLVIPTRLQNQIDGSVGINHTPYSPLPFHHVAGIPGDAFNIPKIRGDRSTGGCNYFLLPPLVIRTIFEINGTTARLHTGTEHIEGCVGKLAVVPTNGITVLIVQVRRAIYRGNRMRSAIFAIVNESPNGCPIFASLFPNYNDTLSQAKGASPLKSGLDNYSWFISCRYFLNRSTASGLSSMSRS